MEMLGYRWLLCLVSPHCTEETGRVCGSSSLWLGLLSYQGDGFVSSKVPFFTMILVLTMLLGLAKWTILEFSGTFGMVFLL